MDYEQAVSYLYGLGKFAAEPGLHRISQLLKELGNPHRHLNIIHVGGTNGKGSTCCYTAAGLEHNGLEVGLYTSPHLQTIRERIQINGQMISEASFANKVSTVKEIVDTLVAKGGEHPTYFEILTAVMFSYFVDEDIDCAVIEVGLGGRFDATNVIQRPLAVGITPVGYDHTGVLGETLVEIAREKSGIIKAGSPLTVCAGDTDVLEVYRDAASRYGVSLCRLSDVRDSDNPPYFKVKELCRGGSQFAYDGQIWYDDSIEISMLGYHQVMNCATALSILEQLQLNCTSVNLSFDKIKHAIKKASWPGRLEKVSKYPDVLLDGAHNKDAAAALFQTTNSIYCDTTMHAVVGVLKDKDPHAMLQSAVSMIDGNLVATTSPSPMGRDAESLAAAAKEVGIDRERISTVEDPQKAVRYCVTRADSDDVVVIWGSLYLVGAVRSILKDS